MAEQSQKIILLVEDDQFLSVLLKNRLVQEGFNVLLAVTGDEALKILETNKPNLILMDIILPAKSGFETMESIMADPKYGRVPVMIISNLGQDSDIARGKQLGAIEYFVKAQISIDEMVIKIKEFLSRLST